MNIIGKKYIYFAISLIVMIPGIVALILWGLNLSIDFTGGSQIVLQVPKTSSKEIIAVVEKQKIHVISVQEGSNATYTVKTKPISQKENQGIQKEIAKNFSGSKELSFETIGPVVGKETTANAFKSVLVACLLIVLYMAWSFRNVPKPASSWRFGVCTIVALLHDVIVVVGIFAILGHFFGVEIDSLFITAVLTVIGFSVHDTIVVFDRVRENLRKSNASFETVINDSLVQTLGRSLNTSLTVLMVLLTLTLFGGDSIRWFVVALLVGILSGTYSSIFNAAPLLVLWEEMRSKKK